MDEKRLEILERSSLVFKKYGIKSITMDDLARELGISKKTIYKYFRDKDDLVLSITNMKVSMDAALCKNCQQNSDNAIDDLINVSKLVVEHFSNVNPTFFYDLKKYHNDAWEIVEKHKWEFVLSMIRANIERGIQENIYRDDINIEIISKLYVNSTDAIMNGEIFPWPEFKFQEVFIELIHFQINGMANENGKAYLLQNINKENNA